MPHPDSAPKVPLHRPEELKTGTGQRKDLARWLKIGGEVSIYLFETDSNFNSVDSWRAIPLGKGRKSVFSCPLSIYFHTRPTKDSTMVAEIETIESVLVQD